MKVTVCTASNHYLRQDKTELTRKYNYHKMRGDTRAGDHANRKTRVLEECYQIEDSANTIIPEVIIKTQNFHISDDYANSQMS